MRVVRQRMIKPFKHEFLLRNLILLLPLMGALTACNPTEITGKGVAGSSFTNDGSFTGKAYVYTDSPYIIAGPNYGVVNPNMGALLNRTPQSITANNQLTGNCDMLFSHFVSGLNFQDSLFECIKVLKDSTTTQIVPRKADGTFIFAPNTPEFYQTNALYHVSLGTQTFFNKLSSAYSKVRSFPNYVPKSIPYYLFNSNLFWFKAMSSLEKKNFNYDYLTTYALCDQEGNASFSPAGPTLCFGSIPEFPGFYFIQDPTLIYHELGHALVSVMMNLRNGTTSSDHHKFRSSLGSSLGYDEGGAINEGIADYFSYVINQREMVGEYGLGKTFNQARPLSESSSMHIDGIEESSEGRLSYPQYLLYDPNRPEKLTEDVHYAGQIMTHYLVALTKSFRSECTAATETDAGHEKATEYVMLLLAETLSELGDLNAKGIDNGNYPYGQYSSTSIFFNNLDKDNSFTWAHVMNQVTYRRFFQVFGKNIYKFMTSSSLCPKFDRHDSEKLMDDYGLLLFKTYNNNGNSTKSRSVGYNNAATGILPQTLTQVYETNRRKSILISKQLIDIATKTDANPNRVGFYIIDNSTDIDNLLNVLLYKGFTVPLSKDVAGTKFNNNNIKVSPGEVVAIIPNLVNNSNSVMAGVQLLAADWDHVHIMGSETGVKTTTGNFKPCVVDSTTTVDQGGEDGESCTTTDTEYRRLLKDSTGKFPLSAAAPVCMVQLDEGNSSRWVSQNEFRKKQGLELQDKDCLGNNSTGTDTDFTFNPHECLVRFLPGANKAFFSKIDPQKTYYESVITDPKEDAFNPGNLMLIEVNKWIPPGTKFRCRMRARFSNCSDCYTNGTSTDPNLNNDDYLDYELNGAKPFKVINFDFDVND